MQKTLLFLLAFLCILSATSQTNTFPSSGNTGIGITTPIYKLQAVSASANSYIIAATGATLTYDADRYAGIGNFNAAIGLPDIGAGLVNYNDGYQQTIGCTMNNKLLWNGFTNTYYKSFRINGAENNYGNYTLEFRNNGAASYGAGDWLFNTNTSVISAWNHGLNIGTRSGYPVKIYSDGYNPAHVSDIYIAGYKVGIGTETPNTNAKLDVNGAIYSQKMFVGTPDANTLTNMGTNLLAVNGTAVFVKAKVAVYGSTWPDYVFSPDYKLTSLDSLEQFIQLNKHLPEIPSASEVEKNGIDLGESQALLLKKIEELTLFTIEQNKRIEKLEFLVKSKGN